MSEGRNFRVEGRVQGVWFRESTRQQAVRLGLTGHALNLPDGSVEVLAFGDPKNIELLADWLQEGPPMAQVSRVSSSVATGDRPTTFSTG